MSQEKQTTSYQDAYQWPKIMPVKIFDTTHNDNCNKESEKKFDCCQKKEPIKQVNCKGAVDKPNSRTENKPQNVFVNIYKADAVNFQNVSCDHNKNGNRNSFKILQSRPKTTNYSKPIQVTSCERKNSNPNLTFFVNYVDKRPDLLQSFNPPKQKKIEKPQQKPPQKQCDKPKMPVVNHNRPDVKSLMRDVVIPCACKNKDETVDVSVP